MTWAYYNEWDPYAAQWLRNLIAAGHITDGEVDERDIREVSADDLKGFERVHFFAGIAGWDLALDLAGWEGLVWTGSCPCPPWSRARIWHRDRLGEKDERDLWPEQRRLIAAGNPRIFFGEQVAGKPARTWLERARRDFRDIGYEMRAETGLASSIGAPARRERTYFAAEPFGARRQGLVKSVDPRIAGPWGWRGEADLRAIAAAPFVGGDRWPQPLVRRMDDGLPARVDSVRACGNSIVPQKAAEFIRAYSEVA